MGVKKIGLILMLVTLVCSFSKGCSRYDQTNMNQCTECQNGYYLYMNKCYLCSKKSNIESCQKVSNTDNNGIRIVEEAVKVQTLVGGGNGQVITNPPVVTNSNTIQITKVDNGIVKIQSNRVQTTSSNTETIRESGTQIPKVNQQTVKTQLENQNQKNFFAMFGFGNCAILSMQPTIHCDKCKDGFVFNNANKCLQIIAPSPPPPIIPVIVSQAPSNNILNNAEESNQINTKSQTGESVTENANKDQSIRNVFLPIVLVHEKNQLNTPSSNQISQPKPQTLRSSKIVELPAQPKASNQNNVVNPPVVVVPEPQSSQTTPEETTSVTTVKKQSNVKAPLVVNIPIVIIPKTPTLNKTQEPTQPIKKQEQKIQMPLQWQIKDYNCAVKNPEFNFKQEVSRTNKRCSKCFANYYYNLTKESCMAIDPLCKGVTQQNQCLGCYPGYNLMNNRCNTKPIQNSNNSKGSNSKSSEYPKNNYDPNCQKYMPNSYKCQVCSTKYYFNEQKAACTEVDPSCKTWNATGYCTSCYDGYSTIGDQRKCTQIKILQTADPLNANYQKIYCLKRVSGKCIKCAHRNYLRNNICLPVDELCKYYHPTFGYCTQCYHGYYLNSGQCLLVTETEINTDPFCDSLNQQNPLICNSCIRGYYLNEQDICEPVSSLCSSYQQSNGHCLSCILNYTLDAATGNCIYTNS